MKKLLLLFTFICFITLDSASTEFAPLVSNATYCCGLCGSVLNPAQSAFTTARLKTITINKATDLYNITSNECACSVCLTPINPAQIALITFSYNKKHPQRFEGDEMVSVEEESSEIYDENMKK